MTTEERETAFKAAQEWVMAIIKRDHLWDNVGTGKVEQGAYNEAVLNTRDKRRAFRKVLGFDP